MRGFGALTPARVSSTTARGQGGVVVNSNHKRKENAISVLSELLEKRDKVQGKLDALLAGLRVRDEDTGEERERDLTPEEEQRSTELLEKRAKLDARIKEENDKVATDNLLAEARRNAGGLSVEARSDGQGADMSVERETMTYGYGSDNSFFADQYYIATRSPVDPVYQAALRRQFEYASEVEREIADGSKFGKHAEKQYRELLREASAKSGARGTESDWKVAIREARSRGRVSVSDKGMPGVESRALTTGGGTTASAGGGGVAAFVTPFFTEPDYVPYREFGRAFADQCTQRPLPAYGMTIYMPQITGPAAVSTSYTEGSGVTETDPTQGFISAGLIIVAGEVTTSQAILDRTGPNFEYDVVIWDQLERDYAQKWDVYVLTQALANATSQSWTGNSNAFELVASTLPGSGGFYGQVSKAKAGIRTTAGTVLNPNRLFLDPARWEFIAAWADSQGRPVVVPDYAGPYNAAAGGSSDGDAGIEGPTGYRFNGLPVYTDHNIPTTTTANFDQAIVADLTQVWTYEGARVHRVLPQTLGGNLQVIFQQFSYGTTLVRYNAAVVKINGSGMSAISYTG